MARAEWGPQWHRGGAFGQSLPRGCLGTCPCPPSPCLVVSTLSSRVSESNLQSAGHAGTQGCRGAGRGGGAEPQLQALSPSVSEQLPRLCALPEFAVDHLQAVRREKRDAALRRELYLLHSLHSQVLPASPSLLVALPVQACLLPAAPALLPGPAPPLLPFLASPCTPPLCLSCAPLSCSPSRSPFCPSICLLLALSP